MGYAINAEKEQNMDGRTLFHRFRYHLGSGFVTPNDYVLDLGCGTGYGSEILAEKAQRVMAFDMEISNIEAAIANHMRENIVYSLANLESIVVPDAEVACCFEVIEHLYKPKEFIQQLKDRIKKYLIVSVPLDQKLVIVDGDPQEENDSTHHSVFTQEEFKNMFIDERWKEFWSFRDGVTFIGVFYNNENI